MPIVTFEASGKDPLVVTAHEGGRLMDLCDAVHSPVEFSCRSADCGTCLVVILEGEGELMPALAEERAVLDLLRAPRQYRLACQARMRAGSAPLRLVQAVDKE
jgi:2Fe-2S ferredoxin